MRACSDYFAVNATILMPYFDAIIDFTSPPALFSFTESAVANNTSLIVGTTGLEKKHFKLLEQAGKSVKVFYAPNMSFGVNSFFDFV